MKNWNKKNVSKEKIAELNGRYGLDPLTSSILIRRGITEGKDILFFIEKDKRFLHNPFLFSNMEDAVDRILQAKDEGEIVMIFGDRDVDGITSTTILYEQLTSMGIEVEWRLPKGNDGYGLSVEAVDDFYKKNGTLIITVDCGISNNAEIAHATELGIDVIVLDHHNPPENLPENAIIVNPKCLDSHYPFSDISGAAVVYKTLCALRFSQSELYKQEICLLAAREDGGKITFECQKIQNLVKTESLCETVVPGTVSIFKTKLGSFLSGQAIYVWNGSETSALLKKAFGNAVEVNFADAQNMISSMIPQVKNMTLDELKSKSKLAKYDKESDTRIDGFFNIFVTWAEKCFEKEFPQTEKIEDGELQLVALAALADIMPLKNENRILVRQGIKSLNEGNAVPGLKELLSKLDLLGKTLTSSKLSWNVVPVLNATGRLGSPELAVKLLLEKDGQKREKLAEQIIELNVQRKELGAKAWSIGGAKAEESIRKYGGKLCVVIDEKIHRGVSGILAGKLVSAYNVPSMAVTFVDDVAVGSMRSCRGFSVTPFLDKMSDIFINHGGHDKAAGFSFEKSRLDEFLSRLELLHSGIQLEDEKSQTIEIDAQLTEQYLQPEILKTVDLFEPYGEGNRELNFLTTGLQLQNAWTIGRPEPVHLRLLFDCGKTKWPAVFFSEAKRLHSEFDKGDRLDVVYQIQRNAFNGNETPQMVLSEAKISEK